MFNFRKNEVTGQLQTNFPGKLVSVGSTLLRNKNGKDYRVGTIEFNDANQKTQRISTLIHEANYKYGMTIGETYQCTASYDPQQGVLVTTSHLLGSGVRADAQMFGFAAAKVEAVTPAEQPNAGII